MTETAGIKYDENKLRFDLIDPHFHKDVAEVLSFGAAKYGENNWKGLEDARNRYIGASERHLNAIKRGEVFDDESGLMHAAHLGCNAMFLHYLDRVTRPQLPSVQLTEPDPEISRLNKPPFPVQDGQGGYRCSFCGTANDSHHSAQCVDFTNSFKHTTRQDIVTETKSGWVKRINKGIHRMPCDNHECSRDIGPADEFYELDRGEDMETYNTCCACHDILELEDTHGWFAVILLGSKEYCDTRGCDSHILPNDKYYKSKFKNGDVNGSKVICASCFTRKEAEANGN